MISNISRTKPWAAAFALLALATSTHAAVIACDDFEDATLGSLDGQTNGTGFAAGYALASGANVVVTNHSLGYASGEISLDGGTNCLLMGHPNTSYAFTREIGAQNGDTLYLGFLFNTTTAEGTDDDFISLGFNNAVGETTAGVVHRRNTGSSGHYFGIRYGTKESKVDLSTEMGRTYFVVFRLRKTVPGAGSNFDELALFVDPSTTDEPEPLLVVSNSRWPAATHLAGRIALAEPGDTYFLDNIAIGTTYAEVVQPTVFQPVISPAGGAFVGSQTVTLSSPTPGATIRYTTDGSAPSRVDGTVYAEPFEITASTQVRAIAYLDGMADSSEASAHFAAIIHWLGAGEDNMWSTTSNWYGQASPAGGDLVFGAEDRTSSSLANNIVDASISVNSLTYTNSNKYPAPEIKGHEWHVAEIGPDVVLTVDGSEHSERAVFVGGLTYNGEYNTYVKFLGGGSLVVDAEDNNVEVLNISNNHAGYAQLHLAGLRSFHANVSNFWAGRGKRSQGIVILAAAGQGTNYIRAAHLGVGDGNDMNSSNGGTSELRLGAANTLHADTISVGGTKPGMCNVQSGKLSFQSGLDNPHVTIRGRQGGDSRCNLTVGSHGTGDATVRSCSGTADLTRGTVDARLGSLVVGQGHGYYWSNQYASLAGTLMMAAGLIDAESLVVATTLPKSTSSARPATGALTISGGRLAVGTATQAFNESGAGQMPIALTTVSGSGIMDVAGDFVMGRLEGSAIAVTSRVDVAGGTLNVGGDMAPGNNAANIVSEVLLNGGALTATNAAGDATLRIENGTFGIAGGTARLDRLVTTNELCTTLVTLAGTGDGDYATVTVNDSVNLGGTLVVALAEGYEPRGGETWAIVQGAGARTGAFAVESLPENFRLHYKPNGYWIANPARGSTLVIR
ncbi:MAG: chitobiase/beta-hexosaminidase C-terminal domain-containing protein [Kiritimatiellia bacterium]